MVQAAPAGTGLLGRSTGDLVLRVEGGPYDGQQLRIGAQRCSIGSAAGCTVRLRRRRVEPVHCLIVRGEAQTVIRTLASDTRLNGRHFADHLLAAGDRLAIGPITFVVEDLAAGDETSTVTASPDPARTIEWNRPAETEDDNDQLSLRADELDERDRQLAEQQDRFRLWVEVADATAREREAELARRRQQLDDSATEIARRQREFASHREQVERELAEAREQTSAENARLATDREQLTAALTELQARQQELQAERNRQAEAQEMQQLELDARREELDAARATFEQQQAERQSELERRRGELEEERLALVAERQELDQARQSLSVPDVPSPAAGNAGDHEARQDELSTEDAHFSDAADAAESDREPDAFEPRRRGAAAEFSSRLTDLREVANLSARATLGAQLRRRQTGKLVVAITGVVSALFIAYLTPLTDIKARFGALVCFLAALVFGAQYLILVGPSWLQARTKRVLETLPEESEIDGADSKSEPTVDDDPPSAATPPPA